VFLKKGEIRGPKGVWGGELAMEVGEDSFLSPKAGPLFEKGDCVHVFEGTGSGQVKMRSVGWFGKVVGMEKGKYLVRNRILSGKGSPALVGGEYLTLQTDFGLGLGMGERTQFRNLGKRSRTRIEESADRRNGFIVREARNEIKKLKSKNANETAAHRERVEKTAAQGKAVMLEDNQNHKEHLEYWGKKWSRLQSKMAQQGQQHKLALAKMVEKNQQHEVRLSFSFHFLHLPLFLSSCLISISLFISVGCKR
jgi:hypothetical protein